MALIITLEKVKESGQSADQPEDVSTASLWWLFLILLMVPFVVFISMVYKKFNNSSRRGYVEDSWIEVD